MCLIAWHWRPDADEKLLLVGNRDESYDRPALPLHWWDDAPILAGRDLTGGGTWLGVSRTGRMAAITNHRNPKAIKTEAKTRGKLVQEFLTSDVSSRTYLDGVAKNVDDYNPFNLLVLDGSTFLGLESRQRRIVSIEPGIGGVSNADFFTPWPKLVALTSALEDLHRGEGHARDEDLLPLLLDRRQGDDAHLPDTGIPREREKLLSPAFITAPGYGTRASTILRLQLRKVAMTEHRFDKDGPIGVTKVNA